jgi:hypothetical protein
MRHSSRYVLFWPLKTTSTDIDSTDSVLDVCRDQTVFYWTAHGVHNSVLYQSVGMQIGVLHVKCQPGLFVSGGPTPLNLLVVRRKPNVWQIARHAIQLAT